MRVEQPQLLSTMHGIEAVVDVQHDAARHLAEAIAVLIDHGAADAQQGARIRQSLPRRRPGFSKREMVGCEHRSASSGSRSIASLNIGSRRRWSASLPST